MKRPAAVRLGVGQICVSVRIECDNLHVVPGLHGSYCDNLYREGN